MSISVLDHFAIPGNLSVIAPAGSLPKLVITGPLADAEIYLLGAHVSHFQPRGEKPVLWLSPLSPFAEGKGIRGGVPVCWPWFGPHKTDKSNPTHGFVRTRSWQPLSTALLSDGRVRVELALVSGEATRAVMPEDFSLRAVITVGRELDVELFVANTGDRPWNFEDCFHTYFLVGNAAKVTVEGFSATPCLDRHRGDTRSVQDGAIGFPGEVTKILDSGLATCRLVDPVLGRSIVIGKENAAQTVVWNPGPDAAAKMPEIADHWPEFVCVEAANCLERQVAIQPGAIHRTAVRYSVEHH